MPYLDGIKPNIRKDFRRVGMAVDSGTETRQSRLELADKLDDLRFAAYEMHLWVQGNPFNETLRAVAEQLRETVDDEETRDFERQGRKELECANCGTVCLVAINVDRTVCDACYDSVLIDLMMHEQG